jgi:replication-associated recombination protein RarA
MTTPTFAFPVRLSEKYRPRKVAEFVGLPKAKRVLSRFVADPYACSFLFFGPPGVGKTSVAMAMAAEMGAEFHHLGSQKCNLDNLEDCLPHLPVRPPVWRIPFCADRRG